MFVPDDGPIYFSTNSGATWTIFTTPGDHEFFLEGSKEEGGFIASATIYATTASKPSTNGWYAVASAADGSKLVLTGGMPQAAPELTITYFTNQVVLSWPSSFTGFSLQHNVDLSSTNWMTISNPVFVVGDQNQVVVSSTNRNTFYRLKSGLP
jgi:hypothetical protein